MEHLGWRGGSLGCLLPPAGRLPPQVGPGGHAPLSLPTYPLTPYRLQGSSLRSPPPPTLPLWSFHSIPPDREFQWVSQLPVSGVLDPATLRQMARPRCGVGDTDGQAAWTERVSALFAARRAKMRRKRFAKQGEL